jgi:hypothetical protein
MPRRSLPLLLTLLCWGAGAHAARPATGLSCRTDSAFNKSTGARIAAGDKSFHAFSEMIEEGDHLIHHRFTTLGALDVDATYRIDRATLHFDAHAIHTRHDLGEEYSVRESGQCEPATS